MGEVKQIEEPCLENKQSAAASSSSDTEGSVTLKSPGVCSPTTSSPAHRYSFRSHAF